MYGVRPFVHGTTHLDAFSRAHAWRDAPSTFSRVRVRHNAPSAFSSASVRHDASLFPLHIHSRPARVGVPRVPSAGSRLEPLPGASCARGCGPRAKCIQSRLCSARIARAGVAYAPSACSRASVRRELRTRVRSARQVRTVVPMFSASCARGCAPRAKRMQSWLCPARAVRACVAHQPSACSRAYVQHELRAWVCPARQVHTVVPLFVASCARGCGPRAKCTQSRLRSARAVRAGVALAPSEYIRASVRVSCVRGCGPRAKCMQPRLCSAR